MNLLFNFQKKIKEQNLFQPKDKLLVAVSGGVDSVVLCELCKQAGYDFVIAHCNFQLRGEESERDELFVSSLGKKYGTEILVKKFDTVIYAKENKISIQEAARELRYSWFAKLAGCRESGVKSRESGVKSRDSGVWSQDAEPIIRDYLLTAHHADDNAETLLMNFCRGTGLHGLTGIPVISAIASVRRPLLEFSKVELLAFAKEHKLEFVEDSSNQSSEYTRNLFRNEIIPAISRVYPQVKENLLDNIHRFKEIEHLYSIVIDELKKKICRKKGKEIYISVKQLLGYHNKALIYNIISDHGFSEKQVEEVMKLAGSESGHYIENASHRIIKHRHWFIIAPKQDAAAINIIIKESDKNILFALGTLSLEIVSSINYKSQTANTVACLDAKEITFPMLLRKWKTGDYFYPLGMKKKKKVSRFFIDHKLSKTEKEKAWVLEMNQKIIWVVSHRIDERFKITEKTKLVLKITVR